MDKLLVATTNPGKLQEIKEILEDSMFRIVSSKDLKLHDIPEEEGDSHREIAEKKARYYFDQARLLTLAEDSGIMVDVLQGELGIKTRRWGAGEKASDEEWIAHFLRVMEEVPLEKRTARFICCACLIDTEGNAHVFEGQTEGIITMRLEAPIMAGLPLSSCFRPTGCRKVYSALDIIEKNAISHRGKAIRLVRDYLERFLA